MLHQIIGVQTLWNILCKLAEIVFRVDVEVISGVSKTGRQNKPTHYTISQQIAGGVTIQDYALRLVESGILNRHGLTATLEEGVIYLDGQGFSHDCSRIIFSERVTRLEVPYSLEDTRNWDDVVKEMVALFGSSSKGSQ